jgi:hypothetical protein
MKRPEYAYIVVVVYYCSDLEHIYLYSFSSEERERESVKKYIFFLYKKKISSFAKNAALKIKKR